MKKEMPWSGCLIFTRNKFYSDTDSLFVVDPDRLRDSPPVAGFLQLSYQWLQAFDRTYHALGRSD